MFGKKSNEPQDRPDAPPVDDALLSIEGQSWDGADAAAPGGQARVVKAAVKDQEPSVISQAVRMEGSIISSGPLHLHCDLKGQVTAPFVLIGATGKANVNLQADEINVEGSLEGDVTCKLLKAGGNALLQGNISCDTLQVALGATVSGNLVVGSASSES